MSYSVISWVSGVGPVPIANSQFSNLTQCDIFIRRYDPDGEFELCAINDETGDADEWFSYLRDRAAQTVSLSFLPEPLDDIDWQQDGF